MHQAPGVCYFTGRSRWHLRCVLALTVVAISNLLVFSLTHPQFELPLALTALALVLAVVVSLLQWYRSPGGSLRWDGQTWHWSGFDNPTQCQVVLRMDWQRMMLVSITGQHRSSQWLWLEAGEDSSAWTALRRAIFSSQGKESAHDETPSASGSRGAG
jgi:toxin CptA